MPTEQPPADVDLDALEKAAEVLRYADQRAPVLAITPEGGFDRQHPTGVHSAFYLVLDALPALLKLARIGQETQRASVIIADYSAERRAALDPAP